MDAALGLIRNQVQFQDITIVRQFSTEIPDIPADPNQLEQVFINILLNASHAMSRGGTLTIVTEMSPDGQFALLRIADTGHGIAPENMAKIFDPFFTTKDSSGTGLGPVSIVWDHQQPWGNDRSGECGRRRDDFLDQTAGDQRLERQTAGTRRQVKQVS